MLRQGKLIAGALAAAAASFSTGAAALDLDFKDVDIGVSAYGDLRLAVTHADDKEGGPGVGGDILLSTTDLHDNTSYWGLKASAASGGVTIFGAYERLVPLKDLVGTSTNANYTSGAGPAGADPDKTRQSYVGLKGSLGSVKYGRFETAYSEAARQYDPFYNTGVSNAGDGLFLLTPVLYGLGAGLTTPATPLLGAGQSFGGSPFSYPTVGGAFVNNQIAYTSPSLGGVTVNLMWAQDEEPVPGADGFEDHDWGGGLAFNMSGISAGVQHIRIRSANVLAGTGTNVNFGYINGLVAAIDFDVTLLSAGYGGSNFGVGLTAERIDDRNGLLGLFDHDNVQLAGWFGVTSSTRVAGTVGYMQNLLETGGGGLDATGYTLGVFHDLGNRLTVHVAGTSINNDAAGIPDAYAATVGASYKWELGLTK